LGLRITLFFAGHGYYELKKNISRWKFYHKWNVFVTVGDEFPFKSCVCLTWPC